jgi:WD40 repeat protein/tetratricopeptide (TPR) repeat protein
MVWDLTTGKRVSPPLKHLWVVKAAFSLDGRLVATAGYDQTVRVWNALTGQQATPPLKHQGPVEDVAFTTPGRLLITRCTSGFHFWDITPDESRPESTGAPAVTETAYPGEVLALGAKGERVLIVKPHNVAQVLDIATGQPASPPLTHKVALTGGALSPNGRYVLTLTKDYEVRVWDTKPARPVSRCLVPAAKAGVRRWFTYKAPDTPPLREEYWVKSGTFSPDSRFVVLTGPRYRVYAKDVFVKLGTSASVWEHAALRPVTDFLRKDGLVRDICVSPDGRRIITTSKDLAVQVIEVPHHDRIVRVWDLDQQKPITGPLQHPDEVISTAFSPDGRLVLTVCHDHAVRLWDANTGALVFPPLRPGHEVKLAAFSPDGRRLVTVTERAQFRVWDTTTGRAVTPSWKHPGVSPHEEVDPRGSGGVVSFYNAKALVAFSQDSRFLAAAGHGFRVYDLATAQPVSALFRERGEDSRVAWRADGSIFLQGDGHDLIWRWDILPPHRPAADWVALAPLASGHHLDSTGSVIPLELTSARWQEVRSRFPADFALPSTRSLRAWHEKQAYANKDVLNWFGVLFHLNRLLGDGAGSGEFHRLRGLAYAHMKQFARSDEDYARAEASKALDWWAWEERGTALAANKAFDRAVADFTRALAENPTNWRLWHHRAEARAQQGRYDLAAADYAKSIRLQFSPAGAWAKLAIACLANGDLKGYLRACREIVPAKDADAHGSEEDPSDSFEHAGSSFSPVTSILAFVLRPDGASDWKAVVRLVEEDDEAEDLDEGFRVHTYLGAALYRAGRVQEAVRELNKAVGQNRDGGSGLDWVFLAMAHHRLGQPDEARKWLQQALKAAAEEKKDWTLKVGLKVLTAEAEQLVRGVKP